MAIEQMIRTHPAGNEADSGLAECIEACFDCAAICAMCADACLNESQVESLRECIATDLACADICIATGRAMAHVASMNGAARTMQLEACAAMCKECGDECAKHAEMHEHCRICAEMCRRCEQACSRLVQGVHAS